MKVDRIAEEPDEAKVSCPVLKTNGPREGDVEFNRMLVSAIPHDRWPVVAEELVRVTRRGAGSSQ